MKLHSFERHVSVAIPANAQNVSPRLHIYVKIKEKDLSTRFYGFFDHFHKVTKLQSFESLDGVST